MVVIWGSYYIFSKLSTNYADVFTVGIFIRLVTLGIMLVLFKYLKRTTELLPKKENFKTLLLIGFLGFVLDITAFLGLKFSTASKGAVLLRTDVFFSNIIASFLGERLGITDTFLTVSAFIGVVVSMTKSLKDFHFTISDLLFLVSAFAIALNAFVIRNVQKKGVSDLVIGYYNNFFTLFFFVLVLPLFGSKFTFSAKGTPFLILAGVFQTLIYIVYYSTLRKFPVWIVRTFLLLIPVYVMIIDFLRGVDIYINQFLGMLLIIASAVALVLKQRFITNNKQN